MAGEAFSEYRFEEMELSPELKRGVKKLGFEQMTPIQAEAIPVLLQGRDVIGQAQTGTGKTAAFGLPLLDRIDQDNKHLQAIILCPTRELAMQVAGELRGFASYMHNVKLLPVYGGQDIRRQIMGLRGVQIIVGTPGRVMDHMRRHTIRMDEVKMCVLDEADEMLKMGFREDMEVILGAIEHPHQTCLFSATMPQEILDITDRFQQNPQLIRVTPKELTIERIEQYYYAVKREFKTQALLRLMAFYQYQKSIVFCNTKAMADELATTLKKEGVMAEPLHGDLNQKQRDIVMGHFRNGELSVLTATDIAARGIDVDDVEAVFNYDVPLEVEYYVHRIGRTGRAGRTGASHTLCRSKDFRKIHEIEAHCHTTMQERQIPSSAVVNEMRAKAALDRALAMTKTDMGEKLMDVLQEYCEEKQISAKALGAAFLKMELGDWVEEVEINLPGSEEKSRRRRERTESDAGRSRREKSRDGESRGRREKSRDGEGRGRREKNRDSEGRGRREKAGFERETHEEKSFAKFVEKQAKSGRKQLSADFRKNHTAELSREERKHLKKMNKQISRRELERAEAMIKKGLPRK